MPFSILILGRGRNRVVFFRGSEEVSVNRKSAKFAGMLEIANESMATAVFRDWTNRCGFHRVRIGEGLLFLAVIGVSQFREKFLGGFDRIRVAEPIAIDRNGVDLETLLPAYQEAWFRAFNGFLVGYFPHRMIPCDVVEDVSFGEIKCIHNVSVWLIVCGRA